jgi:hypothetical protein
LWIVTPGQNLKLEASATLEIYSANIGTNYIDRSKFDVGEGLTGTHDRDNKFRSLQFIWNIVTRA